MFNKVACQNDDSSKFIGFVGIRFKSTNYQILPCDIEYKSQNAWSNNSNTHENQVFHELPCCVGCFQMILTINIFLVAWENATNIETTKYYPESFKYKHAWLP